MFRVERKKIREMDGREMDDVEVAQEEEQCGAQEETTVNRVRVRATGRKNRAWFKYCKSLPTHLKKYEGEGAADRKGVAAGAPGAAIKDSAPENAIGDQREAREGCGGREGASLRASDPSRDKQRRKSGLTAEERCTVFISQKKRLCSQKRHGCSLFCLAHLQNRPPPPATFETPALLATTATGATGMVGVGMSPFTPSQASTSTIATLACRHCGSVVAAAKMEKHLGRCNALRKQSQQEAAPYYLLDANSGSKFSRCSGKHGGGLGGSQGSLAVLGERDFAVKIKECYEKHVGVLEEHVLQASGLDALFEASLAGGSERQDQHGSLYKHLNQDSSIIAHAQRRGLVPLVSAPTPATKCAAATACAARSGAGVAGEGTRGGGGGVGGDGCENKTFVEFGAGKGMLSLAVAQCVRGAHLVSR